MVDIQSASLTKEKILSTIRSKGPTLPIHIARAVNLSPLFASAFLSELHGEKRIKLSYMKVGSSPLYYIPGQDSMLENFADYLSSKEKDAFLLLKDKKILNDESQTPQIRVSLRSLRDFAIPIKIRLSEEPKLFWKYFLLPDTEIDKHLPQNEESKKETEKKTIEEKKENEEIKEQERKKSEEKQKETKLGELEIKQNEKREKEEKIEETKKIKKKIKEYKFPNKIKEYLPSKGIELLEIISEKQKELIGKARINTLFGKQEFYLTAKDKKKLSEEDLIAKKFVMESASVAVTLVSAAASAISYSTFFRDINKTMDI